MLQQFNPGLRGKYYLQRHNRSKEIKQVVNDERWKGIEQINQERKVVISFQNASLTFKDAKEKKELERINDEISLIINAEKEFSLDI